MASLTAITGVTQQPKPGPGPVPPAISAAKRIFVSNAGADSGLFPEPFSGDTDRGFNQFFAALKATGQFDLVPDPSDADLVLELQLIAPNGPSSGNKQNGASDPVPMFRLRIYDRKTHYILWTLTTSIEVALLQKTHDRNFDQALQKMLFDFQRLTEGYRRVLIRRYDLQVISEILLALGNRPPDRTPMRMAVFFFGRKKLCT